MSRITEERRKDPLFLRNQFASEGRYDIPLVRRQSIAWKGTEVIGIQNANAKDPYASQKAVHCFKDDSRIDAAYRYPERTFERLASYACLFTPNYSFFSNMPTALQIDAVFRSRWVGSFWQSKGKEVVANVGWGFPDSYDFCFDGIETGSVVVVSTMGAERTKQGFLHGYRVMLEVVKPSEVWCYCSPFPEMEDTVSRVFPYEAKGMAKSAKFDSAQLSLFAEMKKGR